MGDQSSCCFADPHFRLVNLLKACLVYLKIVVLLFLYEGPEHAGNSVDVHFLGQLLAVSLSLVSATCSPLSMLVDGTARAKVLGSHLRSPWMFMFGTLICVFTLKSLAATFILGKAMGDSST